MELIKSPDPRNLDSPHPGRAFRLYVALTNKCTRSCPFCSMHASPGGTTFIDPAFIDMHVPRKGPFSIQLEGGEPFLHPSFRAIVDHFGQDPRCQAIIVSTNGTSFPFEATGDMLDRDAPMQGLRAFFSNFPARTTFKVSLNRHLLDHDPLLFEKAALVNNAARQARRDVIFNLRKRPGIAGQDADLEELVDKHGLRERTNSFFLQRYGRNAGDVAAGPPFIVGTNWTGVNPDGTTWGTDLVARSNAMRGLA